VNYFAFGLLALIWGTTWVAIKYSLLGFPPFAGAMFRFAFAALVLTIYARLTGTSLVLRRELLRHVIVTAILLYVIDYGMIYWGEQYLNAGVTAILFASLPLATALVSTFAYQTEAFSYRRFAGILVGLAGIVVVFFDQLLITSFSGKVITATLGILIAAIAAAFNSVIAKKHLMAIDTVTLTIHQLIWGTFGLALIALVRGEFAAIEPSTSSVVALLYLGLAGSAIAFVVYYKLLRVMPASTLSTNTYLTPLIAVFTGWWSLGESISARAIIGALIIFAGIATIQFEPRIARSPG
jgi:drug/metabolite transporter (DMT)-like permease